MRQEPDPFSIGHPVRSVETGGFLLTERIHPSNWGLPTHARQAMIIGIVYQGVYTETICRRSKECGPHSLQLLPAGV
jgi:hypothetical protein